MRGGDEEQRWKGKTSTSYGSTGVGLSGGGLALEARPTRTHDADDAGTGTPRFQDDPEEEDFFSLIERNEGDGSSLGWRWQVFLMRPRWWFAVVVLVTLYTLYTNQPVEVILPEPGYVLEPTVYETKWWMRWWSPWGEEVDAGTATNGTRST